MNTPSITNLLAPSLTPMVSFDPNNVEHRNAFRKFLASGKQDKSLRFLLEDGFRSVPELMVHRMAVAGMKALDTLLTLETVERAPVTARPERPAFAAV